MSNEIELKFQINQSDIEHLQSYLNQWVYCDEAEFSSQKNLTNQLKLTNTYYDTEDHLLRQNGCGLRIRSTEDGQNKCYEITVKSKGNSVSGLHERIEINRPLPNDKLDLSVLPKEALPEGLIQLNPLFTTNFKRQTWLISFANSEIEVALDIGSITSNRQSKPIQEVELEIKQGNKQDLINFAIELSRFSLHLFSQSKASRGYRLFLNVPLTPSVFSPQIEQDLPSLLNFWQQNEEYALENNDLTYYKQLLIQINEILINKNFEIEPEFQQWKMAMQRINSIKNFAYSEVNTKFKLRLISEINKI